MLSSTSGPIGAGVSKDRFAIFCYPACAAQRWFSQEAKLIVPAITLYVVLVWFLWGFFMGLGWAIGTWIAGQLLGARWKLNRS
jgi:hypothetical protein